MTLIRTFDVEIRRHIVPDRGVIAVVRSPDEFTLQEADEALLELGWFVIQACWARDMADTFASESGEHVRAFNVEEVVMNDADKAATLRTVKGWVSKDGLFFGSDEQSARWNGCTHRRCECGGIAPKIRTRCSKCSAEREREAFFNMPSVEYVAAAFPFTLHDGDQYFFDEDELQEWMLQNEQKPDTVRLVTCVENCLQTIGTDYWSDELPMDGDLPAAVDSALHALNVAILNAGPVSWSPGKFRVILPENFLDGFDGASL